MKKVIVILVWMLFCCYAIQAQDLNGFWKGTLNMLGCFPSNNIELQINMKDNKASGDSYHYQDIDNYVKKKFTGNFNKEQRTLSLQEDLIITYHIPVRCVICVKGFALTYSKEGNVETLKGQWNGNVLNTNVTCNGGSIILTRVKESAFKEIPEIKVDTGIVRLDFYDNAEIDGDSITVKVDNKVVLSHQRLTAKPLTSYIKIDLQNTFHEVEMIAENLGSIPPNTAVLIISVGEKYHRLYLNATQGKSAKVRFVYEPAGESNKIQPGFSMLKKESLGLTYSD